MPERAAAACSSAASILRRRWPPFANLQAIEFFQESKARLAVPAAVTPVPAPATVTGTPAFHARSGRHHLRLARGRDDFIRLARIRRIFHSTGYTSRITGMITDGARSAWPM